MKKGPKTFWQWRTLLLSGAAMLILAASCSKEPRKVDINDGSENPVERKLIIEVTHRYTNYDDSVLPNVALALYENLEDEQLNRYYRRDTTDDGGKITFNQIMAGEFRIVMTHPVHGEKKLQINVPVNAVAGYEYFYF